MKLNQIIINVKRFGPLEDESFVLAPLMLFTGLSSTGKSYANYLVYYFMSRVCNSTFANLMGQDSNQDNHSQDSQKLVFYLDAFLGRLSENVQDFMRKFLGDETLICEVEFRSRLRKREFFIEINKRSLPKSDNSIAHQISTYQLKTDGKERLQQGDYGLVMAFAGYYLKNYILGDNFFRAVILPPGRGAFVGENFSLKQEVGSSLDMYNSFFRDFDYGLRNGIGLQADDNEEDLATRLLDMTSGGQLLTIESKPYLQLDDEHRIALSASASSVKDMSPWLFYLKNFRSYYSYCLEEPEAHQHPSVTVKIADAIAISLNRGNAFHLTTHSDYLIQRLNQLVKLGGIRRKNMSLFLDICRQRHLNERAYIDAQNIHAYYFTKDRNGKTVVESLKVDDNGIPMKSFFDIVRDLNESEDYISDAIYALSKE